MNRVRRCGTHAKKQSVGGSGPAKRAKGVTTPVHQGSPNRAVDARW
ncbi:hypothetical protein [Streptomyces sp. MI02-7b]|nr:hypothetical protein [Streptomyces sp. MI02-7b]MDX3074526.1 hypothetical protein [Streptomyces sp. MI02-7b]